MVRKQAQNGLAGPAGVALMAAALWGISGTAAQVLFQVYNFPTLGLVAIRSLLAGSILIILFRPKWPRERQDKMLSYALLGVLPSQLFYFLTIAYSNIVIALLLQYLCLPMVFAYEVAVGRFKMTLPRAAIILLAMLGLLMLLLGGTGTIHLSIPPIALVTGLLSAFGVAYYTLFSRPLTSKYGSWQITAWSFVITGVVMLIPGGLTLAAMAPISNIGTLLAVIGLVVLVAILGTLLPYGLFLRALEKLSSTEGSVLISTEPLFAAVFSFLVFGALLTGLQYLGGALMMLAVVVLRVLTPEE